MTAAEGSCSPSPRCIVGGDSGIVDDRDGDGADASMCSLDLTSGAVVGVDGAGSGDDDGGDDSRFTARFTHRSCRSSGGGARSSVDGDDDSSVDSITGVDIGGDFPTHHQCGGGGGGAEQDVVLQSEEGAARQSAKEPDSDDAGMSTSSFSLCESPDAAVLFSARVRPRACSAGGGPGLTGGGSNNSSSRRLVFSELTNA